MRALRIVGTVATVIALTATGLGAVGIPAVLGVSTTAIATAAGIQAAPALTASARIIREPFP